MELKDKLDGESEVVFAATSLIIAGAFFQERKGNVAATALPDVKKKSSGLTSGSTSILCAWIEWVH